MNYYTDMEKCYFVVPFQVSCEFTESCYGAIIIIVFWVNTHKRHFLIPPELYIYPITLVFTLIFFVLSNVVKLLLFCII